MHRLGSDARAPAPAFEVQEARDVAARRATRAPRRRRVRELVVGERCGDLAVLDREHATEAATGLGLGHLDDRRARASRAAGAARRRTPRFRRP